MVDGDYRHHLVRDVDVPAGCAHVETLGKKKAPISAEDWGQEVCFQETLLEYEIAGNSSWE